MTKKLPQFGLLAILTLSIGYLSSCGQTPIETTTDSSPNISGLPAVTDLVAEPSLTEIDLSWTNPDYSSPYYIRVQYKKSSEEQFQVAATLEGESGYVLTDLASLQEYNIRIQTITADGKSSSYSDEIKATTKFKEVVTVKYPAMQNLVAVFLEHDSTKSTWTWSETDFSNFDSLDVYRKKYEETDWTFVKTFTTGVVQYLENPQASKVAYRYTVNYKDGTSANFETSPISYSLPNVTALTAAVVSNDIKLTMTWVNTTHSDGLKSYDIQRKGVSEATFLTIATVLTSGAVPVNTYTDTMVTSLNGSVVYRIKANYNYDSPGYDYSPISDSATILATPLADPTGVYATSTSFSDHIDTHWTYGLGVQYAEEFKVDYAVKSLSGSPLGTTTRYITYVSNQSSYYDDTFLFLSSPCQAPGASYVDVTVQALSSNMLGNTNSSVISAGKIGCDGSVQ